MSRFLALSLGPIAALALWAPGVASGSQLIDRNAANIKLAVSQDGKALLTYAVKDKNGKNTTKHVLVWGAVNALPPVQNVPQVKFQIDWLGGGKTYWQSFKNKCKRYDGPDLADLVVACKAPDGSYWAVQAWQYWIPFFGFTPWLPFQSDVAMHISHWSGPLAQLQLWTDWYDAHNPSSLHDIFGLYTYNGVPVHGFSANSSGEPTDGYGRVVYIDSLDGVFGAGWWRVTGILTRNPSGVFCHAFVKQKPYPDYPNQNLADSGVGKRYRVTVEGPGVTPDVVTEIDDPGDYDPQNAADVQRQADATSALKQVSAATPICLKGH
jgi:hypothetical protein